MSKISNIQRRIGDFVAIPLGGGKHGYGRVLKEPLMAFYNLRTPEIVLIEDIKSAPIAFVIFVMNYAVTDGLWPVIGNVPLDDRLLVEPLFFKKDAVSKQLTIYRDSTAEEYPASKDECSRLECAAVWEPDHVVERLRDYFEQRPNKWVESLRP